MPVPAAPGQAAVHYRVLRKMLSPVVFFLFVGLAAVGAWLALFSNFRTYDDEGLFLLGHRLFLDGAVPYLDMDWVYGPVELAWVQLAHGFLGVPLTHAGVRYLTLGLWLGLALLVAALVHRLTASRSWAIAGFAASVLYTHASVNEPGHPQGLVAVLCMGTLLCWRGDRHGPREMLWLWMGMLVAAVSYLKVNAGLFLLAAVLVTILSHWSARGWRVALAAGSALGPSVLMWRHLDDPACAAFAVICGASCAAVALVAPRAPVGDLRMLPALLRLVAGFALVSIAALGWLLMLGASPLDLLADLLDYGATQSGHFHLFRDYSVLQLVFAVLAPAIAALAVAGHGIARRRLLSAARLWFVAAAAGSLVFDNPGNAQAMLGWAGAWSWVVILPGGAERPNAVRVLLAAAAAWSPLLAYPWPGSQLYFGCLPILAAAVVSAADLQRGLVAGSPRGGSPEWRGIVRRAGLPALALLAAMAGLLLQFERALTDYRRLELLALPGTGALRVEPRLARQYRTLAAAADEADVVMTTSRLDSLYFWTSARFPGARFLSLFQLRQWPPDRQAVLRDVLQRARRPLLIDRIDLRDVDPAEARWIDEDFRIARRVGPWLLLERSTGLRTP